MVKSPRGGKCWIKGKEVLGRSLKNLQHFKENELKEEIDREQSAKYKEI